MTCTLILFFKYIWAGHGDVWHGFIDILLTETPGVAANGTTRRPDKENSMVFFVYRN